MTILEALDDDRLFATEFGATWQPWRALLAAIFGLPLHGDGLELFRASTGRAAAPSAPCREAWIVAGRRAGKSRMAALIAVYLAAFVFREHRDRLARGERAVVMVLAADRRQARVVFRYVRGLLEVPLLRSLVERETAEAIELRGGVCVEVHTASFRSIRGYTVAAAICDEIAFWRDESSAEPDVEILAALRPALATVPGSLLVGISSPYARRGVLFKAWERHYGRDGDPVLVWQAPSRAMNPTIGQEVIAAAFEEDPVAARSEWEAAFRADLEALFDLDALKRCVAPGRIELPPLPRVRYHGFADPSGGRQDAFTLALGHVEDGRAIVDVLRAWRPPFDPQEVCREIAELVRPYGVRRIVGDRFGAAWVEQGFRVAGLEYQPAELSRSDLYLAAVAYVNAGQLELPDDPVLLREMQLLERRRGPSGRDRVDHPPGGHDDRANAVAGLAHLLLQRSRGITPADLYGRQGLLAGGIL